jgi:1,4-dihydroxy-6-naphthoate synthase
MIEITIAHSPDPDDVFMWWPLTGMVEPGDCSRIVSPPELDCGPFRFRSLAADIAVLNRRAIEVGDLDVTAISIFTYASVADRYVLTACGSSMGEGYGPKLVLNRPLFGADVDRLAPGDAGAALTLLASKPEVRIAVPGVQTTAFACLCMLMGWSAPEDWAGRVVERPFDAILPAVARAEPAESGGPIGAGVLIHQSQLTYGDHGVAEAIDFGQWWRARTGLPLPLGGNAVRRDLDRRYGAGTLGSLVELLDRSVRYSLRHRERSLAYALGWAPELSIGQIERYIEMYVSELTVDLGAEGERAIVRLLEEASNRGLCCRPPSGVSHVIRPEGPL